MTRGLTGAKAEPGKDGTAAVGTAGRAACGRALSGNVDVGRMPGGWAAAGLTAAGWTRFGAGARTLAKVGAPDADNDGTVS